MQSGKMTKGKQETRTVPVRNNQRTTTDKSQKQEVEERSRVAQQL
jgi:hypothetical protein